jgi:hypothetical protein
MLRKRRLAVKMSPVANCHNRTHAVQYTGKLIRSPRGGEHRGRHSDAEDPCGLMVDDQLEPARLYDRQIDRLRALENAASVDVGLTIRIHNIASAAHQAAGFSNFTRLEADPRS